MKNMYLTVGSLIAGAALVIALVGADDSPDANSEGFVSLFDGQSLKGWHGNEALWRAEDGAIVGTCDGNIPDNTFLISDGQYGNFILKVKFWLHNNAGNSGIQFRSEELPADGDKRPPFVVKGYQADIASERFMGILYGEKTRGIIQDVSDETKAELEQKVVKDGWNEYVIEAQGDDITQWINGVQTIKVHDPEGAKTGILALQLHRGHDMQVSFKDLFVKPLP